MDSLKWIPYPENIPRINGRYLISESIVRIAYFDAFAKQYDSDGNKYYGPAWVDEEIGGLIFVVQAFRELPDPYTKTNEKTQIEVT